MTIIQQIYKTTSIISSKCDVRKGKSGRGFLFTLIRGDVPSHLTCHIGIAVLRIAKVFLCCTRNAKPKVLMITLQKYVVHTKKKEVDN